jgi:hypothetical protein
MRNAVPFAVALSILIVAVCEGNASAAIGHPDRAPHRAEGPDLVG